jgi:hypothetical protein
MSFSIWAGGITHYKAIIDGKPIETVPLAGLSEHAEELPLDLWIVDLPE